MKKVVHSDMVAHLWAHQTQAEARNAQRNFYFINDVIYSYGGHFPVAKHVQSKGRAAVLLTTQKYSNTTAKHVGVVRAAIPRETTVFRVCDVTAVPGDVLASYADEIKTLAQDVQRRRNKADALARLRRAVQEANDYARFVGSRKRFGIPDTLDVAGAEKLATQYQEQERKAERARAKRRQEQQETYRREALERLERWKNGEEVYGRFYGEFTNGQAFLRVRPSDPSIIETSQGAEFPASHCPRLIALVRSGVPYQHNGHTEYAGVFRVDSIDAEGNVQAGCHYVTRAECERLAAQLGI